MLRCRFFRFYQEKVAGEYLPQVEIVQVEKCL